MRTRSREVAGGGGGGLAIGHTPLCIIRVADDGYRAGDVACWAVLCSFCSWKEHDFRRARQDNRGGGNEKPLKEEMGRETNRPLLAWY